MCSSAALCSVVELQLSEDQVKLDIVKLAAAAGGCLTGLCTCPEQTTKKKATCAMNLVLEVQTRVSYECYRQCLEGLKFGIKLCPRQCSHIII